MARTVSVSQLNAYIARIIGTEPILSGLSVSGEVSNLSRRPGSHWYFSLKDSGSVLRCFLRSDYVPRLRFELAEGMEITVSGYVSVYEPGGYYSFNVKDVQIQGEGALSAAFDALKRKLEAEGLFTADRKRPLPAYPKKIGIVTSPSGAAVRDIITTIRRRNPFTDISVFPCLVQGSGSADSVCAAIKDANSLFPDTDILIVGRGGGSAEDLWTFNEESVTRAVASSGIPVISAVGHETDYVMTDFAADVRAATPTAAAELAVPDAAVFRDRMARCSPDRLSSVLQSSIELYEIRTNRYFEIAKDSVCLKIETLKGMLRTRKAELDSLDPSALLARGYAAVSDMNGGSVSSSASARESGSLKLTFSDGSVFVKVLDKEE